jgi:hypothetical protein
LKDEKDYQILMKRVVNFFGENDLLEKNQNQNFFIGFVLKLLKRIYIILGVSLTFYFIMSTFPHFEYFPSQNAAYHAMMSRRFNVEYKHIELLPKSQFEGNILDQHIGFHYILSKLKPYYEGNWWNFLRLVQSFFLGLFFVFIIEAFIRKGLPPSLALSFLGMSLFFSGEFLNRFYFLRLESVILFFLVLSFLTQDYLKSFKTSWIWYGFFFLFLTVSWIPLVLVVIPLVRIILDSSFQEKKILASLKTLIILSLVIVSSFLLKGSFGEIFSYFNSLMKFTLSGSSGIREWSHFNKKLWPYYVYFSLIFLIVAFYFVCSRKNDNIKTHKEFFLSYTIVSFIFCVLSVFYNRFLTVSYFLMVPLSIYFFWFFLKKKKNIEKVSHIILILSLVGLWQFSKKVPTTFLRWNSEVQNYHETIFQLEKMQNAPNKITITRWEHWSLLSWHLPQIIFEPGLSTLIYESKAPETLRCLISMRDSKEPFIVQKVQSCLDSLRRELQTPFLLIDKSYRRLSSFLKNYPILGHIIFETNESLLFRIKDEYVDLEILMRSLYQDRIIKNNLHKTVLLPENLKGESDFIQSFDLISTNPYFSLENPVSLLRSIMSSWVYCRTEYFSQSLCKKMFNAYKEKYFKETFEKTVTYKENKIQDLSSHLGILSMMGLLAIHVKSHNDIIYYQEKIVSQILANGLFSTVSYDLRDSIFYPGEALLFLYKSLEVRKSYEILDKIEKAFYFYWYQFILTDNPFYIRWLSEVISVRAKFYQKTELFEAHYIKNKVNLEWANYCALFKSSSSDKTWSGLILEGIIHLNLYQTESKLSHYIFCALGALKRLPSSKISYFVLRENSFLVRDDIQAHSWSGLSSFISHKHHLHYHHSHRHHHHHHLPRHHLHPRHRQKSLQKKN